MRYAKLFKRLTTDFKLAQFRSIANSGVVMKAFQLYKTQVDDRSKDWKVTEKDKLIYKGMLDHLLRSELF